MKKLFIFGFSIEDDEKEDCEFKQYELPLISGNGVENIQCFDDIRNHISDDVFEKIYSISEELESEYGIHDWGTGERDDAVEVIGYYTYEVSEEAIPELLNIWKKKLTEIGFITSNWVLIKD